MSSLTSKDTRGPHGRTAAATVWLHPILPTGLPTINQATSLRLRPLVAAKAILGLNPPRGNAIFRGCQMIKFDPATILDKEVPLGSQPGTRAEIRGRMRRSASLHRAGDVPRGRRLCPQARGALEVRHPNPSTHWRQGQSIVVWFLSGNRRKGRGIPSSRSLPAQCMTAPISGTPSRRSVV